MSRKVIALFVVLAAPVAAWTAQKPSPLLTTRFIFEKASLPAGSKMPAWSKGLVLKSEGIFASVYGTPEVINKIEFSALLVNKGPSVIPTFNIEGLRAGDRNFTLHTVLSARRSQSIPLIYSLMPGQSREFHLIVPVIPIRSTGVPALIESAKNGTLKIWIREMIPVEPHMPYRAGLSGLARLCAKFVRPF